MITETGRVVAVDAGRAWVQSIRQSACQSCSARQGCGQRALAGISGGRANQVLVDNHLQARVGDTVTLSIAESALVNASLLVYALPLVLMVLGTVLAHEGSGGSEGFAMLGAASGLGLGFALARSAQRSAGRRIRPQMTRVEAAALPEGVAGRPTIY